MEYPSGNEFAEKTTNLQKGNEAATKEKTFKILTNATMYIY